MMSSSSSITKPEYRVYKNVLRMLKTRKWNVPATISSEQEYTTRQNEQNEQNEQVMLYYHTQDENRIIIVFFSFDEKLRKSHIDKYVTDMENMGATDALIIHKYETTPTARSEVLRHDLELIPYSHMYRCILDHHLVPRYELLTEDEKNDLDTKYGLTKIPRILLSDPISKYFQAQEGDVFKIIRKNKQTVYEVYYRRVVS